MKTFLLTLLLLVGLGASLVAADIGEIDQITITQSNATSWTHHSFAGSYQNPVAVLGGWSFNGGQPAGSRIKNLSAGGCDVQLSEWAYLDGSHVTETTGLLVAEAGVHHLPDGGMIQAGFVTADGGEKSLSFSEAFAGTPVVFAQIASANDTRPACVRLKDISASGFRLQLQGEEADRSHGSETVAWIAISQGNGALGSVTWQAGTTGNSVTHADSTIAFSPAFAATPVFCAQQQTRDGGDTAVVRYRALDAGDATVFVEEETSADDELKHTSEVVGWFAGTPGVLALDGGNDAWTPAALAGLQLWLDAGDADTVTTDGGAISRWADKSGNARHATQATAAARPAYNATTRAVELRGESAKTTVGEYFDLPATRAQTVILVSDRVSPDGIHAVLGNLSPQAKPPYLHLSTNASHGYQVSFDGTIDRTGRAALNGGSWTGVGENVGSQPYPLDGCLGVFEYAQAHAGWNALFGMTNQADSTAALYRANLDCHEMLVLDRVLSASERAKLEGYLAHKWHLAAKLPAGHPYKNAPPTNGDVVEPNQAPTIQLAKTLTVSKAGFTLDATISDDAGTPAITWQQLEGPGAELGSTTAEDLTVTAPLNTDYRFRVTADDGEFTTTAECTVTVTATGTTIAGKVLDDDTPAGGITVDLIWTITGKKVASTKTDSATGAFGFDGLVDYAFTYEVVIAP